MSHVKEARWRLDEAISAWNVGHPDRGELCTTVAQVHATLALVEQQRIANLIALYDMGISDAPSGIKSIDYAALTREIVEALRIGDTE